MKWPVRDLRLPLQRAKRLTINKGVLLEYTEIKGRQDGYPAPFCIKWLALVSWTPEREVYEKTV